METSYSQELKEIYNVQRLHRFVITIRKQFIIIRKLNVDTKIYLMLEIISYRWLWNATSSLSSAMAAAFKALARSHAHADYLCSRNCKNFIVSLPVIWTNCGGN